jgi:hypothetical protein
MAVSTGLSEVPKRQMADDKKIPLSAPCGADSGIMLGINLCLKGRTSRVTGAPFQMPGSGRAPEQTDQEQQDY